MTRHGFTLIELLVSLAISAMMATLLFQALFQASVAVDAGDNLMNVSTKTVQVQQLLERDLSAATTLVDNEPPQETDMTKTTTKTVGNKTIKEEKDEPEGPKEKQIIKKLFFSSTGPGGLGTLTFITNNPLMSFWSSRKGASDKGKPKPYLARVTYIVEEDKASPGSYRLLRQESAVLDYEKKSGRTYEVVDGIKSVAVKFTAKTEKIIPAKNETPDKEPQGTDPKGGTPSKKAPPKKQKPKVEVTYSVVTTWDTDQLKEEQKKKIEQKTPKKAGAPADKEELEEKKKLLPVQVSLEIAFLDKEKKSERMSKIDIGIITDTEFSLPKKPASFMSMFQQQPAATDPKQQQGQQQQGQQGLKLGASGSQQTLFDRLNHLGERLANAIYPGMNQNHTNQNKRIQI